MALFDYNYQNPSVFCFLMLIRAIVLCSPVGLQNLNLKRKTNLNSGSCSQMTPSWKWPIEIHWAAALVIQDYADWKSFLGSGILYYLPCIYLKLETALPSRNHKYRLLLLTHLGPFPKLFTITRKRSHSCFPWQFWNHCLRQHNVVLKYVSLADLVKNFENEIIKGCRAWTL